MAEVEVVSSRNLRKRTPLRQMKLNFQEIGKSSHMQKYYGYNEEENIIKKPKRKSKRAPLTKKKPNKNYAYGQELDEMLNMGVKKKVKTVVKKEKEPDNNLTCLIGWRKDIKLDQVSEKQQLHRNIVVPKLSKVDFSKFVKDLQAIYINIDWSQDEQIQNQQIQDLRSLQLENKKILRNGIIFIWTQKEQMAEIMNIMDEKQFVYIENFTSVQLSLQKCEEFLQNEQNKKKKTDILSFFENKALKKQTLTDPKGLSLEQRKKNVLENLDKIKEYNINDIIYKGDSKFFRQSKKILLMFRRQIDKSVQLELRHQRTSDVVFDLVDENQANKLDDQSQQYVYNMIETLLPKARIGIENDQFKMMEIYGNSQKPRDHWICFNQKE